MTPGSSRWYDDEVDPMLGEVAEEFCEAAMLGSDLSELREIAQAQMLENKREASKDRAHRWRILQRLRKTQGITESVCPECGAVFVPEGRPRVYCLERCAVRARVRRWRSKFVRSQG